MRIIFAVFLIIIVYSCSGISEPKKIALSSDIAHNCMISIPRDDSIPKDLYSSCAQQPNKKERIQEF